MQYHLGRKTTTRAERHVVIGGTHRSVCGLRLGHHNWRIVAEVSTRSLAIAACTCPECRDRLVAGANPARGKRS